MRMSEPAEPRKPKFRRGPDLASMTEMGKLAEYDGWCDVCNEAIDAGISFIRYDDLGDCWVHTWC